MIRLICVYLDIADIMQNCRLFKINMYCPFTVFTIIIIVIIITIIIIVTLVGEPGSLPCVVKLFTSGEFDIVI